MTENTRIGGGRMQDQYARTRLLLGDEGMERLRRARVAVFGVGGVGGYAVEALARSGIGALDIVDDDVVALSNLNRQIIAVRSTVGLPKVEAAARRIHDIDPDIRVNAHRCFYLPETADKFDFTLYDYVVDAIDTVAGKLALVTQAKAAGTPIICCMGAGNKMDPTRLEVADIYETSVCPLARVMRSECRRRGIEHLKVIYSKEPAITPHASAGDVEEPAAHAKRATPGSNAFVPAAAGLIMAAEVVRDLAGFGGGER